MDNRSMQSGNSNGMTHNQSHNNNQSVSPDKNPFKFIEQALTEAK